MLWVERLRFEKMFRSTCFCFLEWSYAVSLFILGSGRMKGGCALTGFGLACPSHCWQGRLGQCLQSYLLCLGVTCFTSRHQDLQHLQRTRTRVSNDSSPWDNENRSFPPNLLVGSLWELPIRLFPTANVKRTHSESFTENVDVGPCDMSSTRPFLVLPLIYLVHLKRTWSYLVADQLTMSFLVILANISIFEQ